MEATLGSVGLDWGQWESVEIVRGQLGLSGDHWGSVGDHWGISGTQWGLVGVSAQCIYTRAHNLRPDMILRLRKLPTVV